MENARDIKGERLKAFKSVVWMRRVQKRAVLSYYDLSAFIWLKSTTELKPIVKLMHFYDTFEIGRFYDFEKTKEALKTLGW